MRKLMHDEVIEIVGPLDDFRVAEIIGTGATAAELTEAFSWLSVDGDLAAELHRSLSGTVARLYDILTADEPEPEDR
jgi:hypothetical protein